MNYDKYTDKTVIYRLNELELISDPNKLDKTFEFRNKNKVLLIMKSELGRGGGGWRGGETGKNTHSHT